MSSVLRISGLWFTVRGLPVKQSLAARRYHMVGQDLHNTRVDRAAIQHLRSDPGMPEVLNDEKVMHCR